MRVLRRTPGPCQLVGGKQLLQLLGAILPSFRIGAVRLLERLRDAAPTDIARKRVLLLVGRGPAVEILDDLDRAQIVVELGLGPACADRLGVGDAVIA